MKSTLTSAPDSGLTDAEIVELLQPSLTPGCELLAVNQSEALALLRDKEGALRAFSYVTNNLPTTEGGEPLTRHHLTNATEHTALDLRRLFGSTPIGTPKAFQSSTEHLYVIVHRVGKRRILIDEIGNRFVKANGRLWKFPEQVSY